MENFKQLQYQNYKSTDKATIKKLLMNWMNILQFIIWRFLQNDKNEMYLREELIDKGNIFLKFRKLTVISEVVILMLK